MSLTNNCFLIIILKTTTIIISETELREKETVRLRSLPHFKWYDTLICTILNNNMQLLLALNDKLLGTGVVTLTFYVFFFFIK